VILPKQPVKLPVNIAGQSLGASLYDQPSAPSGSSGLLTSIESPQSVVTGGTTGIAPSLCCYWSQYFPKAVKMNLQAHGALKLRG